MEKVIQKVLNGEAVQGKLGLGLDEDSNLHIIFQEEGSDEVMEEVVPAYMLAMASQLMG